MAENGNAKITLRAGTLVAVCVGIIASIFGFTFSQIDKNRTAIAALKDNKISEARYQADYGRLWEQNREIMKMIRDLSEKIRGPDRP